MKRMITMLIIFALCTLIILGAFIYCKTRINQKNNPEGYSKELLRLTKINPTYGRLLGIRYSSSGDMNGNIDTTELDVEKKILITEYRAEMGDPIKVVEYSVTNNDIESLLDDIHKYNFPMWKELEIDYSIVAEDAPQTGITFIFNNRRSGGMSYATYHVDHNSKIPKDGREYLHKFEEKLFRLKKDSNKIKEYTRED